MIGVDKPASLLYPPSFVSFSSSSPPAQHTQPGNRRGVLLLSRLWLPHSRVSMRFSSPLFFLSFKNIYIYIIFIRLVWLFKPGFTPEVSQSCLRGEDLHSGRTMRWVKRLKSLHLHCVSRLHFVFRLILFQVDDLYSDVVEPAPRCLSARLIATAGVPNAFTSISHSEATLAFSCFGVLSTTHDTV